MKSIKSLLLFGAVAVCLVSIVNGSLWEHKKYEYYDSHPQYKFEYSVHDPHTHDIKSQEESRDGDYVKGYYKLKESDGSIRVVHYTADKHSGFNAEITKDGLPLFDGQHQPISHHYSIGHGHQDTDSSHHGYHAISNQNQNSQHYHQHKVVLHHHY